MKICTLFSNWSEALFASETSETSRRMIKKLCLDHEGKATAKPKHRAEPARNPGTPPARCPETRQQPRTPTSNMIHSWNSNIITLQRKIIDQNFYTEKAWCETQMRYSHWKEHGLPRMTPGLPFTDTYFQCSSWKRQLQYTEGMAAQNINPGHRAAFYLPTGVATRDDPRPSHIDSI